MEVRMQYALKERIGHPDLFCGRETEMKWLMEWSSRIPRELAKSQALLGRRKSGKTAIMQRLFNVLWNQNGQVIPFYFEVRDSKMWLLEFAKSYFYTFLSHYFSFVYRKPLPANIIYWDWERLVEMAHTHGNDEVIYQMKVFQSYVNDESTEQAIDFAFAAPAGFFDYTGKNFLVMIDEIQYMTEYIYYDKVKTIKEDTLPGLFHGLVELKFAPMLVAGSYIGWMMQMMQKMFVGSRLRHYPISPKLDFKGGMEAVYKYAQHYEISLTPEIALMINRIVQCDPYYMTALFCSPFRDFSSVEGVINTFVEEISNKKGELYMTWMEYINISINKVNDRYAKQILLILSRNRYQKMGRDKILEELKWSEDRDRELEEKLRALEYAGLIESTTSSFHYQGIPDDILDLLFRERYQHEIYNKPFDIKSELRKTINDLEKDNRSLKSQVSELKGRMLELVVWRKMNQYRRKGQTISFLKNKLRAIPEDLKNHSRLAIVDSMTIRMIYLNYYIQSPETGPLELDVLVEGMSDHTYHAVLFEIKNRDEKNLPSEKDLQLFVQKIELFTYALTRQGFENIVLCPVYFSANGFDNDSEKWLHEHHIYTADMVSWKIDE
jgi:hypothetical protein